MFILISILLAICMLFYIIHFFRRKYIIRKVRGMDRCKKLCLLNDLAAPFGFSYVPEGDIMTSTLDAWQKNFGYCRLYDKSASRFNMILDCEPVYFNYNGRTWMVEFWKGQYGINLGGEIGIYKADGILSPEQYDRTMFQGVSDSELLPVAMKLYFKGQPLFLNRREHWWLTGFRMGSCCQPEDLVMDVSVTFPSEDMLQCFVEGLRNTGYARHEIYIRRLTVSFAFSIPHTWQPRRSQGCRIRFSQWQNRITCRLFRLVTRPFTCTMDRILYLYFFLPPAFHKLLCFKRSRKQKFRRKQRKCK